MEMPIEIPKGRGFTPFPFGQCQVCGAEATGNHYGANTCEGCKGFFKRSLPVFRTFRCFFGNKCDVSPETRNRCKACRFRKCIEAGMALDAVKMGRIPKAIKETALKVPASPAAPRSSNCSMPNLARQASVNSSRHSSQSDVFLDDPASPSPTQVSGDYKDDEPGPSTRYSVIRSSRPAQYNPDRNSPEPRDFSRRPIFQSQQSLNRRFHPYEKQENGEGYPSGFYRSATGPDLYRGFRSPTFKQEYEEKSRDSAKTNGPYAHQSDSYQPAVSLSGARFSHCGGTFENLNVRSATEISRKSDIRFGSTLVSPVPGYLRAAADMAMAGEKNSENLGVRSYSPDQLRTEMATNDTAVAVAEPSLQGKTDCAPVVPRDVIIFRPSFVSPDKMPKSPVPEEQQPRVLRKHRKGGSTSSETAGAVSPPPFKIPTTPTPEFFADVENSAALKQAMCEHTFRSIRKRNDEIYGEETRANEVFLRDTLSSGNCPHQPERTPQQMRDILKDRLITQVKRVVLLSESIPGFRHLDMHDQHSLLRTCILDTWMVHSARFLRNQQSYLIFLESNTFYARYWMELFLTDEFLQTVFEMANRINSLDLSFDELALLKSIVIVRSDRPNLHKIDFIKTLHDHLLDALRAAIRQRRPMEASQLWTDLTDLLEGWRILDVMQEKYVHPIDLSHFSQGPWKVGGDSSRDSRTSASPVSSKCTSPSRSLSPGHRHSPRSSIPMRPASAEQVND